VLPLTQYCRYCAASDESTATILDWCSCEFVRTKTLMERRHSRTSLATLTT